jgi:hypothetical protein
MQTPLTNSGTPTSLVGNSRSLEMQTDSRSTHHRNHHLLDDPKEAAVEAEVAVEAVEAAEGDYPRQQDQACFPPHGRAPDTKFLGSEPEVFTGDRTKVESFLTQWELYCGVNANNAAIQNQYQKTMLFLTYVKGDLVRTWVLAASRWLGQEVSLYHVDQYDPYLWTSIEGAFRRQFADTLEME